MTRWVLHVDLDQFLAAVEVLRRPELRGRPVVVGGRGDPTERGVVSTASYEARAFGVHSGLPLRTAARRCPDAVFLPVDFETYEAASAVVMATLRELDAVVEVLGWDEAFLGVETDDPEAYAAQIQRRVLDATGLECSRGHRAEQGAGQAGHGLRQAGGHLPPDRRHLAAGPRRPRHRRAVGHRREDGQEAACGRHRDRTPAGRRRPGRAGRHFGPTIGPWLVRLGTGRDRSPVSATPWVRRSRGREVTYQQNLEDWDEVRREVAALARRLAGEVAEDGRPVVRVAVKVRYAPFFTSTHARQLPEPTLDAAAIEAGALAALEVFTDRRPVRLLGVRTELERTP